ncbi:MAG: winged helix-turn-helix transcriptional regulator [Lachnospiraceae bacterium]|nr:winged helix-turn-helix transcriptional regulator [Lachnospiraceae bacterium]
MGASNVFKVLSDAQRRDILEMLKNGRMSAGEIAEKLDITPAALSYHLRLLKEAELVSEYRSGNFIYYELNTTVLQDIILWVRGLGGD